MDVRVIDPSRSIAVQRLLESNAEYSRRVTGAAPTPAAAGGVLSALPPGSDVARRGGRSRPRGRTR